MTVISSPTRLWIKASPRGTRSGFAVLPDGAGGRVTVTVLPKPWSSKPGLRPLPGNDDARRAARD